MSQKFATIYICTMNINKNHNINIISLFKANIPIIAHQRKWLKCAR